MLCEVCHRNNSSLSAVIDGVYYKHVCYTCRASNSRVSSGHARWARGIDVEDSEADIQQPWNSDGTPNKRFIQLYPEQAKALWSQEEMDRIMRR